MNPVGKPDAGKRHVRFDERGEETERCRMAQATAPLLDSTRPSGLRPVVLQTRRAFGGEVAEQQTQPEQQHEAGSAELDAAHH